jgi:hypothetical protein
LAEIETLKKTIENHELQLMAEREKFVDLENKRQGIENS